MYAGAYQYAAKEDPNIFHGNCLEKHPELSMISKNKVAELGNAIYREISNQSKSKSQIN